MPKISFRWHSPAYGKVHRDRLPEPRDFRLHRLYGLMIGGMLIGVYRITHTRPPKELNKDTQP